LLLALGAGVVDAISLTTLGVFTAAVTANVVLVGIALGEGDAHAALRAGIAVAAFAGGVFVTARGLESGPRREPRPARAPALLAGLAVFQAIFLAVWLASEGRPDEATRDVLIAISAVAMGGQTVIAGVWNPGIAPIFVTGMLSHLLADLARLGRGAPDKWPKLGVIVAVSAGAALGGLMLAHTRDPVAIVPLAVTALAAVVSATLRTR
jgi:uncharacterized membrane protein YoaK (UPF0700 family)